MTRESRHRTAGLTRLLLAAVFGILAVVSPIRPGQLLTEVGRGMGVDAGLLDAAPIDAGVAHASTDTAQTPAQRFGACLAGGGEADLLLLVDESSSIAFTDPGGARATSLRYFLDTLETAAERDKSRYSIQLAAFSNAMSVITPWSHLDAGSMGAIRGGVESLRQRVNGVETDYWTALDGGRQALEARRKETPNVTRCQAIVFVTDGKLDISPIPGATKPYAPGVDVGTPAGAAQATSLARDALCKPDGLADRLAAQDTVLFGIGLAPPGTPPTEFDVLQSIVTGTGSGGTRCGKGAGSASGTTRGDFALASDIDELIFAFDAISNPGKSPVQQRAGACGGGFCDDQVHRMVLDVTTPTVRILATSDQQNLAASLRLPDGTPIEIAHAPVGQRMPFEKYGFAGTAEWKTDRTLAVEIAQRDGHLRLWQGLWRLAMVNPAGPAGTTRTNIHLAGSLTPTWDKQRQPALRAGQIVNGATFRIALAGGKNFDVTKMLGSMRFSGTILDGQGQELPLFSVTDPRLVDRERSIDLAKAKPGRGQLVLRLDVTTAAVTTPSGQHLDGMRLEPALVSIPLTILAPGTFPELPERVEDAEGDIAAGIPVEIPTSGVGCVWLADGNGVRIDAAPATVGTVTAEADAKDAGSCVRAGEPLRIRLVGAHAGEGTVSGAVPIARRTDDASGAVETVPVSFTVGARPPLGPFDWAWRIGLGLLAFGLLVALLMWLQDRRARIRPGRLAVVESGVRRMPAAGGEEFALERPLTAAEGTPAPVGTLRYLRVGDLELRARRRLPGQRPRVRAIVPDGCSVWPRELPLDLAGAWCVVRSDAGERVVAFLPRTDAEAASPDRPAASNRDVAVSSTSVVSSSPSRREPVRASKDGGQGGRGVARDVSEDLTPTVIAALPKAMAELWEVPRPGAPTATADAAAPAGGPAAAGSASPSSIGAPAAPASPAAPTSPVSSPTVSPAAPAQSNPPKPVWQFTPPTATPAPTGPSPAPAQTAIEPSPAPASPREPIPPASAPREPNRPVSTPAFPQPESQPQSPSYPQQQSHPQQQSQSPSQPPTNGQKLPGWNAPPRP